jgi:hypothetical protein
VNGVNKLGLLPDQITAPGNWPQIVLNNFGQHAVCGRLCTYPDGGTALFSLWKSMEEFSELLHRGRKHHLIVRTGREIKNRYPNEVTDDLGIHCDDMPVNGGLENHPTLIVLSHLKVGIEESDEPGEDNASTCVQISPMVSLDSL